MCRNTEQRQISSELLDPRILLLKQIFNGFVRRLQVIYRFHFMVAQTWDSPFSTLCSVDRNSAFRSYRLVSDSESSFKDRYSFLLNQLEFSPSGAFKTSQSEKSDTGGICSINWKSNFNSRKGCFRKARTQSKGPDSSWNSAIALAP
jgi:hypothetical protein